MRLQALTVLYHLMPIFQWPLNYPREPHDYTEHSDGTTVQVQCTHFIDVSEIVQGEATSCQHGITERLLVCK